MSPIEALMKRYDEKYRHAGAFERGFYRFEALKVLGDLKAIGCTVNVPARLKAEPAPKVPGIDPEDF